MDPGDILTNKMGVLDLNEQPFGGEKFLKELPVAMRYHAAAVVDDGIIKVCSGDITGEEPTPDKPRNDKCYDYFPLVRIQRF